MLIVGHGDWSDGPTHSISGTLPATNNYTISVSVYIVAV